MPIKKNIGFIGAGNMGSALIKGILMSAAAEPEEIWAADKNPEALRNLAKMGVNTSLENAEVLQNCDVIFLAVKPNIADDVLEEAGKYQDKLFISIMAGVPIRKLESHFSRPVRIVRTMPNTPAFLRCGMTVMAFNENAAPEDIELTVKLFECVGLVEVLPERYINAATGLMGSSPAYVYMMIDAMADAGVKYGLTRAAAVKMAARAVEGAAKMVLETGEHPAKLKDSVCSPGGTTIEAVCVLEETGFRASLQQAIAACIEKADNLS